jgi:uncharacterized protein with PIN domain
MSIEKRRCPQCQGRMTLTSIEPEGPGMDRRIFDCGKCGRTEKVLVKFH